MDKGLDLLLVFSLVEEVKILFIIAISTLVGIVLVHIMKMSVLTVKVGDLF